MPCTVGVCVYASTWLRSAPGLRLISGPGRNQNAWPGGLGCGPPRAAVHSAIRSADNRYDMQLHTRVCDTWFMHLRGAARLCDFPCHQDISGRPFRLGSRCSRFLPFRNVPKAGVLRVWRMTLGITPAFNFCRPKSPML